MSESAKVYVGNLAFAVTEEELSEFFGNYGEVVEAKLITDRETGRSRGFGFVTFAEHDAAKSAIDAAHDQELQGRKMTVNFARENEGGARRGGGGQRRGPGGGNHRGDRGGERW